MKKCFKLMVAFLLAGSTVKATEENKNCSMFQSGIGVTFGLGVSKAGVKAQEADSELMEDLVCEKIEGIRLLTAGRRFNSIRSLDLFLENESRDFVDFSSSSEIKNRSGFSWNLGVLAQKKMGAYTVGVRWIFGSNGSSARIKYDTVNPFQMVLNQGGVRALINGVDISVPENSTVFVLKNKWCTSFIFEFGYLITNRMQIFAGPGLYIQKQKLCCINDSGKSSGGLSKTICGPMVALGARYALTQRISVGMEYQHHFSKKTNWNRISEILPSRFEALGTPSLRTSNNLFLITMTYMFGAK
ncbi:outer membrane protein [Holospora undulata]|uniref:Outer membrane protein beta-barrel domain-containing protein n=1 Tax=Holospora undulata HU1 TaxID=1321371 RepID=A0A061JH91_9PROT|nr:hypothetical protein [Holospora undulata]ETZ04642.1 hypothetical protein K737_300936 [Holospora undulata HU1]